MEVGGVMRFLLIVNLMFLFLVSCSEDRPVKLNEEQKRTLFDIKELGSMQIIVTTASTSDNAITSIENGQILKASGQISSFPVTKIDLTDERLKTMFQGLQIEGFPSNPFKIRLEINKSWVIAYKVIASKKQEETLGDFEKSIMFERNGEKVVAIFQLPIDKHGVIVRDKNEYDEETGNVSLVNQNFEASTHIEFSPLASKRVLVGLAGMEESLSDQYFLVGRLDNKMYEISDFVSRTGIEIKPDPKLTHGTKIFTQLSESGALKLMKVATLGELTTSQLDVLKNYTTTSDTHLSVKPCSVLGLVINGYEDNCFLVDKYKLSSSDISYVSPVSTTINGVTSWETSFQIVNKNSARIVKISSKPTVNDIEEDVSDDFYFDPEKSLKVASFKIATSGKDFKDWEQKQFLFRRTMMDVPNSFEYAMPGSAGKLKIINFSFEKDHLNIIRAHAMFDRLIGNTDLDKEILMSFPVKYFKLKRTNGSGEKLATPQIVQTTFEDSEAVAILDWNNNLIPDTHSPLEYYGLAGFCFLGKAQQIVEDIDLSKENGVLGLSLKSTYPVNPSAGCTQEGGYFDDFQSTFTFKERVSFKEYVADTNEEVPLMSLPFSAQKKLRFGYFTYDKNTRDSAGGNTQNSVMPMGTVIDFRDKTKTYEYVLAGIPSEEESDSSAEMDGIRGRLIESTKKVVANINAVLHQAFSGTDLDRNGDFVTLKVESLSKEEEQLYGVEGVSAKYMGDLDRNYIYYIKKALESGILGLGGNHHNPRNGKVENGSVYIYGGNLWDYMDYKKQKTDLIAQYQDLKKFIESLNAEAAANTPTTETSPEAAPQAEESTALINDVVNRSAISEQINKTAINKLKFDNLDLPSGIKIIDTNINRLVNADKSNIKKMIELSQSSINKYTADLIKNKFPSMDGKALQFVDKIEKILQPGVVTNSATIEEIFNDKKSSKAYRDAVVEKMEKANIDVHLIDRDMMSQISSLSNKFENMSKLDIFIYEYGATLAHEIMHNFGLRHNFIGSFDKNNFQFKNDDGSTIPSDRNYSSVMDYEEVISDGLAPHDVYALRAGYTNLLELADNAPVETDSDGKQFITVASTGQKITVVNNRFIRINDIKGALNLTYWEDLNSKDISRLHVKEYLYCTDEDAGLYPTCNRFDIGTSAVEIADNIIDNYQALYPLSNYRNKKISMTTNPGSYIGYLFRNFTTLRQFLEETFYQSIFVKADQAVVMDHAYATDKAFRFFNDVIRGPEPLSGTFNNAEDRFIVKEVKGKKVLIFAKPLKDTIIDPGHDDSEIKMRGVEYDKIVALLHLFKRSLGYERYTKSSLTISYYLFEKILYGVKSAEDSLVVNTLTQILNDDLVPFMITDKGLVDLDNDLKAPTSEMLRYYAGIGAMAEMDIPGVTLQDNPSTMFRFISNPTFSKKVADVFQAPGAGKDDLRYAPLSNASSAKMIAGTFIAQNEILSKQSDLLPLFQKWLALALNETPENKEDLQISKRILEVAISKLPDSIGFDKNLDTVLNIVSQIIASAQSIEANSDPEQAADFEQLKNGQTMMIEKYSKRMPILALALNSVPESMQNQTYKDMITTLESLGYTRKTLFDDIENLTNLFQIFHPEYN